MAAATVVHEAKNATVWFYETGKIIHHQFRGFMAGAEFRGVLDSGLNHMSKVRATKWLSDDRGNGATKAEDSAWAMQEWFPRALKAGWKFWAIVMPKSAAGQLSMKRFIEENEKMGLKVRTFETPEEALAWLQSV